MTDSICFPFERALIHLKEGRKVRLNSWIHLKTHLEYDAEHDVVWLCSTETLSSENQTRVEWAPTMNDILGTTWAFFE